MKKIYITKPILISKGINFANNIFIWPNARIELVKKYNLKSFTPRLIIENRVSIQQNCHITCAEDIIIAEGIAITQNVGIFDIVHSYNDIKISPKDQDIVTKKY